MKTVTMMKRLFLMFTALMLCVASLEAQDVQCYEIFLKQGISLYRQGKYVEAKKIFQEIKEHCDDIPANNDLDTWIMRCSTDLRISEKQLTFDATGDEEKCVEVTTNARSFKVSKAPSWCTVNTDDKRICVTCEDNFSVSSRSARVTITAGGRSVVLEVNQESAELEVSVDPESLDFSNKEETKRVAVTTNASDWQVGTFPEWAFAQKNDDILLITCMPNVTPHSRQAFVSVAVSDQEYPIKVFQSAGDTLIKVGQNEMVFDHGNGSGQISVESNMAGWTVKTSDPWITVTHGNDSITVLVSENPSLFSRHGSLRISVGKHFCDVAIHQRPYVSTKVLPPSELRTVSESDKNAIMVTSIPSNLKVYLDDSIVRYTPFPCDVDYEHHSLLVGFERRECFFNDKQQDVVFKPGIRFATLTLAPSTAIGLMTGFVGANSFGAFSHFQVETPVVSEFATTNSFAGYNLTFGAVFQPVRFPYIGAYAGVGAGAYTRFVTDATKVLEPRVGFDYEAGIMGFYKNLMLTAGFHRTMTHSVKNTSFVLGVGGYLKRYYDSDYGYCASDSRRWWSLNYVFRPAEDGKGLMFGDLGKEKARAYIKAIYLQSPKTDTITTRDIDFSAGMVFTPVNGLLDLCVGVGADFNLMGKESRFQGIGAEFGVILNVWRFPITFILHEADLFGDRHMCVDFGVGFHFGDFKRNSYK